MITKKSLLEAWHKNIFPSPIEKIRVSDIEYFLANLPDDRTLKDDEPETSGYIQERPVDGGGGTNFGEIYWKCVAEKPPKSVGEKCRPGGEGPGAYIPGGCGGDPNFDYSKNKYIGKIQLGISKEEELQSDIGALKHRIEVLEGIIRDMAEVIGK